MVDIPCDNVELDSGEEGEVNNRGRDAPLLLSFRQWAVLHEVRPYSGEGFRMIILQIIGEKFGGMENSLYLCGWFSNKY